MLTDLKILKINPRGLISFGITKTTKEDVNHDITKLTT